MPKYSSLQQVQQALHSGAESCEGLVSYYLQQIEQHADLNIYVEVYAEEAKEQARKLDQRFRENPQAPGRLHGMVLSLKDVLCYEGHGVTAGSRILEGFESQFSATAVARLLEEDAIVIGRVNCDEFAMGSTTETSVYGPSRNADNPDYVPGGSSGGSAVAVQADTCLASLGTDTGGSVRQPAAFCGIIGVKPTYGRISRYGLLAYGSSFDQVGVLVNSVEDAALLLEIMAGPDEFDSTSSQTPVPPYSEQLDFAGKARIAYFPTALEHPSLDPEVRAASQQLIEQLRNEGHTIEAVDFDYLDYIIPAYYVLTTAEASSNLSRYDGIRYGYRSGDAHSLMDTYKKSRTEGFGTEVKRRIMLGTFVLSAGYYDAYYTKAQQVRRLIQEKTLSILEEYDFILIPAAPGTAWKLGDTVDDPVAMYLADIFTVQANMVGIPAVAFPLATHSNGLPIGLQLMAGKFEEARLLAFLHDVVESVTYSRQ
ncbi:Asp-tRNA(Asn)/Glu-tRNA(Gln) amidotransferase subunit GatA [Flavilitoribacter nigricans]|uniref:Glutamyl-tRNA(Gln) amidotransferase subunit A n=1 Tax=Flavilitoribacter nigricans (strain ATCC 23147 / DSM 23189 / NBRC 102662 / NCIMB 1420 / SS-2) TaxID=1122177 RepID=A0A2D0MYQ3_FLAN2|nr:Asp-tRNA(Asn)/Glu-tRNA(Gln) amidotransferase subunit GatA [Flavilitoribacter nigricans]PHN01310.1 Asp-tRNA(Asn)/Glu-tRNA(Gln) amidotransferase GatCAB subunit A [Flavilitoribacter nigricans DSM 23189 = NBRC 102662]